MRKKVGSLFLALLVVALSVCLSGCNGSDTSPQATEDEIKLMFSEMLRLSSCAKEARRVSIIVDGEKKKDSVPQLVKCPFCDSDMHEFLIKDIEKRYERGHVTDGDQHIEDIKALAYLFFIKDQSRFLPVSPGNFEKSLASVGIDYKLSGRCNWENYNGFIKIVKDVQAVMQDILPDVDIRLIDAHSFLWVINESKRKTDFLNWRPDVETAAQIEDAAEKYIDSKVTGNAQRRSSLSSYFTRSAEVVRITKDRAKGICQLCGQPAPFTDKNGKPYLEAHHIVWLSRGGVDNTNNTVALCPNCHTKMHVVDDEKDVEKLKRTL